MSITVYDEHGKEINLMPPCKCGKISDTCITSIIKDVQYSQWICNECLYGADRIPVELVYNPPDTTSDHYKRAKIMLDGLKKNEKLFAEYGGCLRCMTSDGRNVNMAEELNRIEAEKQSND